MRDHRRSEGTLDRRASQRRVCVHWRDGRCCGTLAGMGQRAVNEAQQRLLDWLAAGGSQDPAVPEMKLSAAALKTRGLVRVSRPGGKWTATLTDAGRFFIEHGTYPPDPEPARPRRRKRRPRTPIQVSTVETATPEPVEPLEPEVPLRQVVRNPHPAVKEVRDRPARLPRPFRRRCVLLLHLLVEAALERGWTVTPVVPSVGKDAWGTRRVDYPERSLLLIDAGHAPVGFVFEERTRRVDHVETEKERRDRLAGRLSFPPRYDYVPTGQLRVHTLHGDRRTGFSVTDGVRVRVEDKFDTLVEQVAHATEEALAWAEARRKQEEEAETRRREHERIRGLRARYDEWETALHAAATGWQEQERLTAFVNSVDLTMNPDAAGFVTWARAHITATDPRSTLPSGDPPDWAHEKRVQSGKFNPNEPRSWF